MAIPLDDLVVQIRAEASGLQSGLRKAEQQIGGSASRMTGAVSKLKGGFGALAVGVSTVQGLLVGLAAGALVSTIKQTLQWADALDTSSQRLGVNSESLQRWRFVASQFNVGAEQMDMAMSKLARTTGEAAQGNKKAADSFRRLGLDPAAQSARKLDDVMQDVLKRIGQIRSSNEQAAVAQQLFGRSGSVLLPIIRANAEEIERLIRKAEDLGIVIDQNTIKSLSDLNDKFEAAAQSLKIRFTQAVVAAAPVLDTLATKVTTLAEGIAYLMGKGSLAHLEGTVLDQERLNAVTRELISLEGTLKKINEIGLKQSQAFKPGELDKLKQNIEARIKVLQSLRDQMVKPDPQKPDLGAEEGDLNPLETSDVQRKREAAERELARLKKDSADLLQSIHEDFLRATEQEIQLLEELGEKQLTDLQDRLERELISEQEFAKAKLELRQATEAKIAEIHQRELDKQIKAEEKAAEEREKAHDEMVEGFIGLFQQLEIQGASTKQVMKALLFEILEQILKTDVAMKALQGLGSGIGGLLGSIGGAIFGTRASGGRVLRGAPTVVGERKRPELFIPESSGVIVPDLDRFSGGTKSGGGELTLKLNVITMPGEPVSVRERRTGSSGQREVEVVVGRVISRDRAKQGPISRTLGVHGPGGFRG